MKTLFRVLALSVVITAFSAVTALAQTECDVDTKKALYTDTFLPKYKGNLAQREEALAAGKKFVELCKNSQEDAEIVAWLNRQITRLEEGITIEKRNTRFDTAYKSKNWDDLFAVSKEILAKEGNSPLALDIQLLLATVGFESAAANPPVNKFNADAINYAKSAMRLMEQNVASQKYGLFDVVYNNKANAQAWMNYAIGYITYYRLAGTDVAKKKEALPYLYKAVQFDSTVKKVPLPYAAIGDWYLAEAVKMGDEQIKPKTEKYNEMIKGGTTDTDEAKALYEEIKSMTALQKGYAERAIDAYARALQAAKDSKESAEAIKNLSTRLEELYVFRFDKKDGQDAYVSATLAKPMPDPSTPVTPVVEEKSATTTSMTVAPSVNNSMVAAVTAKPAIVPAETAATAKAKVTAAKKPVAKKKGNR